MAFRTSETVTVSELLAPGSCTGSLKIPKCLLNGMKRYHFGEKTEAASHFSKTLTVSEIFMTHPHIHKTSEMVPFSTY